MKTLQVTPKEFGVTEEVLLLREDDLEQATASIHWEIRDRKIYDANGHLVKCQICKKELTTGSLGAFFPGSLEVVCDEFACFVGEMARIRAKIRGSR